MPWYDPWDLETALYEENEDEMKTPKPAPNDPRVAAIMRAQEKLRSKKLPKRTSTYVEGSIRQTQGAHAEVEAQNWLMREFRANQPDWVAIMWQEAKKELFGLGPFDTGGEWEAIRNSQNGDLYIYRRGPGLWDAPTLLFSIEVKSSAEWPSAAVSHSELFESSATYLLGNTTYGIWICTMDQARKHAKLRETYKGSFYTVDPTTVMLLTIKDIIDAEERPKRQFIPSDPDTGDIPF